MSKIKLTIVILWSLLNTQALKAQDDDKTVTLVVSGQGKTQDDAKQNALRSAIEQAFGAFISSKTEIINDSLIKDEIVSISSGNIQKYEIISEVQIPGGDFVTSLNAVVSISKLTFFCESKGVEVEFKGGLFAANIKIQKLNDDNEVTSIKTLCETSKYIVDKMFDYNISYNEPKSVNGNSNEWYIKLTVGIKINTNFDILKEILTKNLNEISMNSEEVNNYESINKSVFHIRLKTVSSLNSIYLRNEKSVALLQDLLWYIDFAQADFIFNDGLKEYSLYEGKKTKTLYEVTNYLVFDLPRYFDTNWKLYSEGVKNYPIWGTAVSFCRPSYGEQKYCNYGCSYELTKENIKTKFQNDDPVYVTGGEGIYKGYYDKRYYVDEPDKLFNLNLNPSEEEYGKFCILKKYTTDELEKIGAFTVRPGKFKNAEK